MNSKLSDGRPPELLKSLANRLARSAMSPDQQELTGMLRLAGLLGRHTRASGIRDNATAVGEYANAERVGIWERQAQNGASHFVRSLSAIDDWLLWANVQRIEQKGPKLRVLLIGESVARGYLYEPQFTPALALSMILEARIGKDQVEVIDLARTNLSFGVVDLALSALALEPDAVIIFSGNNWRCPVCPEECKTEMHEALCQSGLAGLKDVGSEWLRRKVRTIARDVSSAYRAQGIPLIWIVPEFNLADWRIPPTNAPHLPEGANREWLSLLYKAGEALAGGQLQSAAELARKAVDLDHGTSVAAWQILAECSLRQNDFATARLYLESARDAVQWYGGLSISPGTISLSQEVLREEAVRHGDLVVDSPRLFADYLGGELPGRQLFLDYCHLTVEGIRITMAAAASCVLRAIKGVDLSWQDLAPAVVTPPPEVDGEAAFLAAIHNAHWWQPSALVHHYCLKAVRLAPHLAQVMNSFLEIQTRRAPMLMCAATAKIAESGSSLLRHYLLHYNRQQLDRVLLDGIVAALKTVGINAQETLDRLRREEHSFTSGEVNLLDDYYCSSSLSLQDAIGLVMRREGTIASADNQDNHHYKAYWRESRFVFVGERGYQAQMHFSCRLPHLDEGAVRVEVNGRCEAELSCGREWTAWDISIPGERVVDGLNEVTVNWPMPEFPGVQTFETMVADMTDQLFPEFLCLFGEIESFRVSRSPLPAGAMDGNAAESVSGTQCTPPLALRRRSGVPLVSPQ